jgi:PhzF family phenazine biosynthesis protein
MPAGLITGNRNKERCEMGLTITQVDAFADKPFTGNPAAVCLLEQPRDGAWMQLVAREMNLSETAFLAKRERGYDLRWFSPTVEIDLCGHATLASAHVLWEQGILRPDETVSFHTKSGVLPAKKEGTWIEMDFPATPAAPDTDHELEDMEAALGVKVKNLGRSRFDYLAEVESENALRSLEPDFTKIGRLITRGLIVTSAASGSDCDFVSRFFAPAAGINEDPVTGSAHCCLGPFWSERFGRDSLIGYQASTRGGFVRTRCQGDRVLISGQAVTVMRGELV